MNCHVSRQCDEHARSLSHDHETVGEQVIDDYGWPRLEELARALRMSEDDITDALVEHRLNGDRHPILKNTFAAWAADAHALQEPAHITKKNAQIDAQIRGK